MGAAIDHSEYFHKLYIYSIFVECVTASLKFKLIATFVYSLHLFILRLAF